MDTNKLVDNGFKILSEIHQKITFADSKANFLVAVNAALFGALITLLSTSENIFTILLGKEVLGGIAFALISVLALVTFLLISLGIYNAIRTINPRLSSNGKKQSLIYFGAISNMALDDFRKLFKEGTEERLAEDIINQIHENSIIATNKFANVKTSATFLIYSLLFTGTLAISIIILKILI